MSKTVWSSTVDESMVQGWSEESIHQLTEALDKAVEAVFTTIKEGN